MALKKLVDNNAKERIKELTIQTLVTFLLKMVVFM